MKQVGETGAAVFEVHMMMLEDADYRDSVLNIIRNQKTNAEYAAAVTGDNFYRLFADMSDEYFRARAADVKDITDRLIKILSGNAVESGFLTRPVILMAEDLAPSETVQLEKDMLLGFITEQGSPNSHTAILARSMNIPALVSVEVKEVLGRKDGGHRRRDGDALCGSGRGDAGCHGEQEAGGGRKRAPAAGIKGQRGYHPGRNEGEALRQYRGCLRCCGGLKEQRGGHRPVPE